MREQSHSTGLSQDCNAQSHPCKLESVSEDIEVSGCEDEQDDEEVGNAGSSGVFP